MDARGKFGEHERSVRVARGAAERTKNIIKRHGVQISTHAGRGNNFDFMFLSSLDQTLSLS